MGNQARKVPICRNPQHETPGFRATQAYLDVLPEWECTDLIFKLLACHVTPKIGSFKDSSEIHGDDMNV